MEVCTRAFQKGCSKNAGSEGSQSETPQKAFWGDEKEPHVYL